MKYPFAFIDESGNTDSAGNRQPFFGLGFLKIDDNCSKFTTKLLQKHFNHKNDNRKKRKDFLQQQSDTLQIKKEDLNWFLAETSHKEYHFTNITTRNLNFYKEFISSCAGYKFEFRCIILKRKEGYHKNKDLDEFKYWDHYLEHMEWLSKYISERNEKCTLVIDFCSQPKDGKTVQEIVSNFDGIANVMVSESLGSPLIQLCDLLLGSIIFQFKEKIGMNTDSLKNKAKREFISHMINSFSYNVGSIETPLTRDVKGKNSEISVWRKFCKKNSIFEQAP